VSVQVELAPKPRSKHLYEIDVLRILTFACVIAVHVTSHTSDGTEVVLNGFLALVHFTREVFFGLSSFVLVYSYLGRPQPMRRFWSRRFLLVGVPYLTWSAIYVIVPWLRNPVSNGWVLLGSYVHGVLWGSAWYHLYFLLVTMQLYLVFPVLMWIVRKTRGHHFVLLVVAGLIQLVISGFDMYKPGSVAWIRHYPNVSSYVGFIIAGAVAADHSTTFLAWVRGHRGLIAWLTASTGLGMLGVYVVGLSAGYSEYKAGAPFQPMELIWSAGVGLGFLALGTWWADRRDPTSRLARGVDEASDLSFGIFLAHPLVLWVLLWAGSDWAVASIPRPWLTLVAYVVVVIGATAISFAARRTPLSLELTGRPWRRRIHPPSGNVEATLEAAR
jgi:peptidoglycan/LPS O-acetylase OafA/YrhL